ncbi:hypothetical protein EC604_25020 [Paenibacillus amylolyticus]|uniref:Uncharacterized protein n=3 Tax=Paenibacillus TaxID=44249 RepID=A0A5M9X004_PAEAM|nr:hypothetical protein EC604_25020 [Paenibacillus amylolyticus]
MSQTMTIRRIQIKFQSSVFTAVALRQKDINIKVREELGHLLLVDAKDCSEMFLLASLFQHAMCTHDIIYFAREDESSCDLLVFNGAITPINQKDIKHLKIAIKYTQPGTYTIPLIDSHDESIWMTWQH